MKRYKKSILTIIGVFFVAFAILLIMIEYSVAKTPDLTVAIMDTYPWGYFDENQNPAGIYYDFAKQIIEESDLGAEYIVVPYPRAILNLETGEADITLMYSN